VKFNPFNSYQLVTSGFENITFWKVDFRSLVRQQVVRVGLKGTNNNAAVITCFQFMCYHFAYYLNCDLLTGNNFGDLGVVTKGVYVTVLY